MMEVLRIRQLFVMSMLFLLAACTTQGTIVSRQTPPQWDEDRIVPVIATGYYTITDVALKPVPMASVAVEAMRGIATLDPLVQIDVNDGKIAVFYGERPIAEYKAPLMQDSESWADLTYDVLVTLAGVSGDLHADTDEQLYEALFDGALSTLDIFSRYAGRLQAQENRDKRDGYGALDLNIREIAGRYYVAMIDDHTPAQSVGLQVGDELVALNQEPLLGVTLQSLTEELRGPLHSEVVLTIRPKGHEHTEKRYLWRTLVIEETVFADFDGAILHLRIDRFNERTAQRVGQKIAEAVLRYGSQFQGIILDLRNNPGGLLKKAVQVADVFLAQGRIITTSGRHPDSMGTYGADSIDSAQGRPMVVLINGKSASASEIVAASLQDRGRAVIVGTSSYGKGTVQTVQRLPNEGEMTLTWSRLMAPSGYAFHGLGVHPDVCTSGFDLEQDHFKGVRDLNDPKMMAQWRSVGLEDIQRRRSLRQHCAPNESLKRIDPIIARHLIESPTLYQSFLQSDHLAVVEP